MTIISIISTFNHLADAFIQSNVRMRRIIEEIRASREQQYTSVMTGLSQSNTVHVASLFILSFI